jgi:hypothetical protein
MRRSRSVLLLVVAALFASACSSSGASARPDASAAPSTPTETPIPTGEATPAPTATPGPTAIPGAAQWVSAGSLHQGRAGTYLLPLKNGNVLVVGDENACASYEGLPRPETIHTEIFDQTTGTWTQTGDLSAVREGFAAAPLPNGGALVAGGQGPDMTSPPLSTEIYDPATATWSTRESLGSARQYPAVATLQNGRVLVISGAFSDTQQWKLVTDAEIFDPATGKWSPAGKPKIARELARAVTLSDGRVLLVGGSGNGIEASPLAEAEIWDPQTGTWSEIGSLATPRYGFSLVALRDGSALVAGGFASGEASAALASAERLDPATMKWKPAGQMASVAGNRITAVLPDGRVLLAGGIPASNSTAPIAAAELYDPATGAWTPTEPLPAARERGGTAPLADGSILVAGGDAGCPTAVPEALRYIPPAS